MQVPLSSLEAGMGAWDKYHKQAIRPKVHPFQHSVSNRILMSRGSLQTGHKLIVWLQHLILREREENVPVYSLYVALPPLNHPFF